MTIWKYAESILTQFWMTLAEMSPFLLLGFAVAGVLSVLVASSLVRRHLGGEGVLASLKAAVFGVPLPLCSCGVIPVSASLRRSGAGDGPAISFLISTPQTGVDSILVTWSLLGGMFAILRPIIALATGVVGGAIVSAQTILTRRAASAEDDKNESACDSCGESEDENGAHAHHGQTARNEPPKTLLGKIRGALEYGFLELPSEIGKPLLIGVTISAFAAAFVPDDFFQSVLGGGLLAMIVMALAGVPVYVCATASVPLAAVLVAKGASPGAALVFLMTGPATNAATVATVWRVMGRGTAITYLLVVVVAAVLAGLGVDLLMDRDAILGAETAAKMLPAWLRHSAAAALILVVAGSLLRPYLQKSEAGEQRTDDRPRLDLAVEGMTCSHCAASVEQALADDPAVEEARVDLKSGRAIAIGPEAAEHVDRLIQAIESVGYRARKAD